MKATQPINNMVVEIVNRKSPGIENLAITLKVSDLTKFKTNRGESCVGYGMQHGIPVIADTVTGKGLAFPQRDMRIFMDAAAKGDFKPLAKMMGSGERS
ncbi:MAG: hypothetical protein NUV49_03270 [Patescibacteria group bacterium]|nr:hypothetical protein [Patescibacteria group bacterium]